jgi:phage tail sheath protein FI
MYGGVSGVGITSFGQTLSADALPMKTNQLNSNNAVDGRIFVGVNDMARKTISDRLKRTVTSASGTTSADHGVLIFATTGDVGSAGPSPFERTGAGMSANTTITNSFTIVDQFGSNSGNFSSTNKVRFTVPMFGGWDGFDPRKNQLETEQSTGTDTLSGDFNTAIKILANPDEVDFNLIAMPGITSSAGGSLTQRLLDMCSTRADAFGIIDIADTTATGAGLALSVVNAQTEAAKYTSNYGATYYPWVRINDIDNDKLVWVPPSVAVMGAFAFNDRVAQPWFAPAGFNRGGLDEVLEVRRRLTQGQRDDLYTNNVNPIATFPGQGIVVFGQKTLQVKQSVLDRINVRRMMIEVRKTIAGFSRLFIFEPNSVATRERLLTQVNDYLSSVQAANGVNEFRAVLDETTTTPDLIDRNIIKGKIFLKPTTAAEIVIFDFTVTPNGAAFSE